MDLEREIVTTEEAAKMLDVKKTTILKYVKDGELTPVYKNHYIDKTKLFYKDDIEKLQKALAKPGLTTSEAGKMLGVHSGTILQYIQQGQLKAERKEYRGKIFNFISFEELERFKSVYEEMKKSEGKEFYDKKTKFAWFQEFQDQNGTTKNFLLLDEHGQPYLATENGQQIAYKDIKKSGYEPFRIIPNPGYINKKGFAKFEFTVTETFCTIMNYFYQYLGTKNLKVFLVDNQKVTIEVKPILIKEELTAEEFQLLEESVVEGSVTKRLDGFYIDSDLEIIQIAAPSHLKEKVREDAEREGVTMEEFVLKILKEKYDK
ncbi:helix-turn-helix domain-containing protein [Robertmurraya sp. FSL R5-0851]|uniref:helix-turn-helix domain-containing protein n=1 Tax=Robertmurraya sp. FSL R5-0851 TaxID=2921584 RepID=UPI0030FA3A90